MFHNHVRLPEGCLGFPRVRGDVPETIMMFEQLKQVFPAYAGMFPWGFFEKELSSRFPRVRGDVPNIYHYSSGK